jgi:hypothetical protein
MLNKYSLFWFRLLGSRFSSPVSREDMGSFSLPMMIGGGGGGVWRDSDCTLLPSVCACAPERERAKG